MEPSPANNAKPPINQGLLELIRSKQEFHWKPSIAERQQGFRGWHQRGYLPHFDALGITQFVTFQLHDSFPVRQRRELESMLQESNQSLMRRKIEAALDRGHGCCWLREPDAASAVQKSLLSNNNRTYRLRSWIIMPNHVHLVVEIWQVPLAKLINHWKGTSARHANQVLKRTGPFWQADYFDTLIRDDAHCKRAIRYVEQNPMKACLVKAASDWSWTSASKPA